MAERRIAGGERAVTGLMMESFLEAGRQELGPDMVRGRSVTDACMSWGTTDELLGTLADAVRRMLPSVQMLRMVSSGTEATMSAIRLARGVTGRSRVLKFEGCYHGHSDSFLIQAGSGAVTFGSPNSPGVTQGTAKDTLLADYNDLEGVKALVEANKGEIAAIILEPVAGNMGCIIPKDEFIQGLRDICTQEGILLLIIQKILKKLNKLY